jgi:hypothetical protein
MQLGLGARKEWLKSARNMLGKRTETAQIDLRMWMRAQVKQGIRAHPKTHLSDGCFQGSPKGLPVRKLFPGTCKICPKSMPKSRQKLLDNTVVIAQSFLAPSLRMLSFFTLISFFLTCHSPIVQACHYLTDLNKNTKNSKPVSGLVEDHAAPEGRGGMWIQATQL